MNSSENAQRRCCRLKAVLVCKRFIWFVSKGLVVGEFCAENSCTLL
jgi:hypothetical protein